MRFIIKNKGKKIPEEVLKACNNDKLLARLMFNRNITTYDEATKILDISKYEPYNPVDFPHIADAVAIITESIENKEKISIYGDYDVDGVTATTVLVDSLRNISADVIYHVPDRFSEGYGMSSEIVKSFSENGVKTIITCDCGISNFAEIDLAKQLNMKVILTDHHTIGEKIPNADVIINPKLLEETHPARNISGCATAYYLVKVLYEKLGLENAEDYLDLVALSLIADVVPLVNESRYLLKKGIVMLKNPKRIGLKALINVTGNRILSEEDVGFYIAPRINAAGRMDSAKLPIEMFLTNDESYAAELAEKINNFNTDRKNIQKDILEMVLEKVENEKKNKKIFVIYGDSWHHGIIGIVAGRVCELYNRPCILLTLSDDGENVVGSARSTENINIYEVLSNNSKYLTKFGGHSGAAGLSLKKDNLEDFLKDIETYADIYFSENIVDDVEVDLELKISDINKEILTSIEKLSPYGESFESPHFCSFNLTVSQDRLTPAGHHFLTFIDGENNKINGVIWNGEQRSLSDLKSDITYSIFEDTYNGNEQIKLKIENFKESGNETLLTNVDFIDKIDKDIVEVVGDYPNALIFYEGPLAFKPNLTVYDIDNMKATDELILYSLPRNKVRLREIIDKSEARKIIMNYSYVPNYEMLYFSRMFLGYVKNIVNNKNSIDTILNMSKILNVDENFILTFSNFMTKQGYINYKIIDNNILFEVVNKEKVNDFNLEKTVKRYLSEKEEYTKYSKNIKMGVQ